MNQLETGLNKILEEHQHEEVDEERRHHQAEPEAEDADDIGVARLVMDVGVLVRRLCRMHIGHG